VAQSKEKDLPSNGAGDKPRRGRPPITFDAQDWKYDLQEFLAPGQDDRGASARLTVRIPPAIERELEILVQSRKFPYRTTTDIVRHALYRHSNWLHRLEPDIPRHYNTAMHAILEVVADTQTRTLMQDTFKQLDHMVDVLVATNDETEAIKMLQAARSKMINLPDSRWKRQWLETFSRKYEQLYGRMKARAEEAATTEQQEDQSEI